MTRRAKHPNKHIEAALVFAEEKGWDIRKSSGGSAHAWGVMYCPLGERGGHQASIYSTPEVPEHHATRLRKKVGKCTH